MEAVAQAAQHLKRIRGVKQTEWSEVSFALSELASAVESPDLEDHATAVQDHLTPLATELSKLLVDIRSKLVADTCDQLSRIVKATGLAFAPLADLLLPGLSSTAKASSIACRDPGFRVFSDVSQFSRYDLNLIQNLFRTSPQERVRVLLFDQIQIVLTYWPKAEIQPFYAAIVETMRRGMIDPSSNVRAAGRQTFCSFSDIWIERADELVDVPSPPARDTLVQEKPYAAITKAIAKKYNIDGAKDARQDSIRQRRATFRKQTSSTADDAAIFIEVTDSSRKPIQQVPNSGARGVSPARGAVRGVSPARPSRAVSPVTTGRSASTVSSGRAASPVPSARRASPSRSAPRGSSPAPVPGRSQSPRVSAQQAPSHALMEPPRGRMGEYERYLSITSAARASIDQHFAVLDAAISSEDSRRHMNGNNTSQVQSLESLSPVERTVEVPLFVTNPQVSLTRAIDASEPRSSPKFHASPLNDGFLDRLLPSSAPAPMPRASTNVTTRDRRRTLDKMKPLAPLPVAQPHVADENASDDDESPPFVSIESLLQNPAAPVEEPTPDSFEELEDKENVQANGAIAIAAVPRSTEAANPDVPSKATTTLSAAIAKVKQMREESEMGSIFDRHLKTAEVEVKQPAEAATNLPTHRPQPVENRFRPSPMEVMPPPAASTRRTPVEPAPKQQQERVVPRTRALSPTNQPKPPSPPSQPRLHEQSERGRTTTRPDFVRVPNQTRFAAPVPHPRPTERLDPPRPPLSPSVETPQQADEQKNSAKQDQAIDGKASADVESPRLESRRQPVLKPKPPRVDTSIAAKLLRWFCLLLAAIFAVFGMIYGATTLRDANEMTHAISTRLTTFEAAIVESHDSVRKMDEKYAMWSDYIRELTEQDEANALLQLESIQRQVEQWQIEMKNDLLEFKQSLSRDLIDTALAPLRDSNATLENSTDAEQPSTT